MWGGHRAGDRKLTNQGQDHGACANLGKHRVVYGVSWLLRVIDHEAALVDPNLFSSLVRRSVSGVVETGVWTAEKQPVALLAKK
jgi:hypothetical protein